VIIHALNQDVERLLFPNPSEFLEHNDFSGNAACSGLAPSRSNRVWGCVTLLWLNPAPPRAVLKRRPTCPVCTIILDAALEGEDVRAEFRKQL
jgi:hypothetical protein